MQRILCISTAREKLDAIELDSILKVSRRNNAAVGVTGLLVVGGRRFLQVLEGPDDQVAAVFDRISRDDRHFAVVKLSKKTVETRLFGEWAMGYRTVASAAMPDEGNLSAIVERLIAPIDDIVLRAEFTAFAALHAAA
ncbi:BLUF domain-containing protein [Sphingomonas sp. PAMC 26617]|uniref:BLUF domain-containing protein n=1 Tax=Sphingomonas sp. PAMC 26617 TaxID=1112216 RepID=UPI0002892C66|nr:BLUF domain-containing protein [Sphingomonas sp. PAMC 26617]